MPETEPVSVQPQQLTELQFRELRGKYFTVRHYRVKPCNHLLDQINEPTFRNCENCWFTFFSSHGELVQVTDKAMQEQGAPFLDKMRGCTYRKMFCRYMSTLARLKREQDGKETGIAEEENRTVEGAPTSGIETRADSVEM
jgi:hypothetical protein